jgi:hypothetical protein
MQGREEMAARHAAALGRLAELSLALAEDLQAAALACDQPAGKAELANAFHRIARTTRQSLALEAKLARDLERGRFEAWERGEAARRDAVAGRKHRLRLALDRLIWTEQEPYDAPEWDGRLEDALEEEGLAETFLDEPLETQVERLRVALDLTGQGELPYIPRAFRDVAARHPAPHIDDDFGVRLIDAARAQLGLPPDDDDEDTS